MTSNQKGELDFKFYILTSLGRKSKFQTFLKYDLSIIDLIYK